MFSKTLFVIAFAAIAQLVVASPPACLLGAVNQYSDPSDIEAVCKSKDASSKIAKLCGDDSKAALEYFADKCNDAGVEVSTKVSITASATATASGYGSAGTISASASGNGTTLATTIASATGGSVPTGGAGSPSATGTGSPAESTGAAGKLELSAAALLAGLGVMAAAL